MEKREGFVSSYSHSCYKILYGLGVSYNMYLQ